MAELQDKELICADCNKSFTFPVREQEFYRSKGFSEPKRCKDCRAIKQKQRNTGYGDAPSADDREKSDAANRRNKYPKFRD